MRILLGLFRTCVACSIWSTIYCEYHYRAQTGEVR